MQQIKVEVENLNASPLYTYRQEQEYLPVIGEGDLQARFMFIGEAPGKNEAKSGRPFVGAAGKVLDELLGQIKLRRDQVYITNIVKDRPPENRDPTGEELTLYAPYLDRQINIIQPQVIITLGRFAMDFILERFGLPQSGGKISDLHGQILKAEASYGRVDILPLFHPAAVIYRREWKELLREDFQQLCKFLP
jgi:DNA polymerase